MNVTLPNSNLNLKTLFPFELDEFQYQAIAAINANKSVVVSVPTGSGKTVVGEYAIYRALARGRRVFYTTPLKALSNQKFRDFSEQFGAESVGLLTGDISINRDAPVVVMTTEIFRNMLYGTPIGQVGTSLEGVEAVVLDECHYMNDRQRGTVWEESIIYSPKAVQLLALSATIANAEQLTAWIHQVHGPTELIQSNFRPVPLDFYFSNTKGLFPLLNRKGTQVNSRLKLKQRGKPQRRLNREHCPHLTTVLRQLQEKDMLPAIYFIFSRRGCDRAVQECESFSLVTPEQSAVIQARLDEFLTQNPNAGREGQVEPLTRGIAAHHAGILPAWKGFVEELFQEGLVKVVFATETLAAGINMPARTTVISSISKRTDRGHRLLTASEFLQMAGRAGRRGMDEKGYVVTIQTPFEGADDAAKLALAEPNPLVSQFTPNYGMVLNLLQTHSVNESQDLLERSFAQYIATLNLAPQQKAIAQLTTELAKLDVELAPINPNLFSNYEKLKGRLKEERRLLKTLQKQAETEKSKEIAVQLYDTEPGQILYLKGKHVRVSSPVPSVLVAKAPGKGQAPYLVCLGFNNRWYVVSSVDVVSIDLRALPSAEVMRLIPPNELMIQLGQCRTGDESSAIVANHIPNDFSALTEPPEVIAQQQRMEAIQAQADNHPLEQWGKPSKLLKRHKRRLALRQEISDLQAEYRENQTHHWQEFLNLVQVLREFNALEGFTPTPLGEAAAAIRGDNELWLGLAIVSGHLDDLDPHHLAAIACALISEPPRPDTWADYAPAEAVINTVEALYPLRRDLIQRQHKNHVALPVWLEYEVLEIVGIVEQWALGVEWDELCDNTSLDEGDIVRILRRTVDLLSQLPHVPGISEGLRRNAIRAMQLMERFPVKEVITEES
ncbi:MAG: DEAD/DEAH box helicase [Chroococcales cyanobacterium]